MNSAPRKRTTRKGSQTKGWEAAHSILRHNQVELQYLHHALRQANILFWFSLVAVTAATALQLYMIVWAMTQAHTELQVGAKLMLGLSFNTVAVVAYRQAREFRQRAAALLVKTRRLNLAISLISGRGEFPPLTDEWLELLQSLLEPEADGHKHARPADKDADE